MVGEWLVVERGNNFFTASFSPSTEIYIGVGKEGLKPTEIPCLLKVDANGWQKT
jgi:hypothetical protein